MLIAKRECRIGINSKCRIGAKFLEFGVIAMPKWRRMILTFVTLYLLVFACGTIKF